MEGLSLELRVGWMYGCDVSKLGVEKSAGLRHG